MPAWTKDEICSLKEQAAVHGNRWSDYSIGERSMPSIRDFVKRCRDGKCKGQNAAEWKAIFAQAPTTNTGSRAGGTEGVAHVSHHSRTNTYMAVLDASSKWDGSRVQLLMEGKAHCIPQAVAARDAGVRELEQLMSLGAKRPKGVSEEDVEERKKAAREAAARAAEQWEADNPEASTAAKESTIDAPKRYQCAGCDGEECEWKGSDVVWYKYFMSVDCAKRALGVTIDPVTNGLIYTDADTGEIMSADGWFGGRPSYEDRIAEQHRDNPEAWDRARRLRLKCKRNAQRTMERYHLDDAFRANWLGNKNNRARWRAKNAASEERFETSDIDLSNQPTAEDLIKSIDFEKMLEANPGGSLLIDLFKASADLHAGDGDDETHFQVRHNEQLGFAFQPNRPNPILTPHGYHLLYSSFGAMGRDCKSPAGKIGYRYGFSVRHTDNEAFRLEEELVAAALAAKAALPDETRDRIIILNTTAGGNGSQRKSRHGFGAAGFTVMSVKPEDFRFREDATGLDGWLDQAPKEFHRTVPMNEEKLAMLKRNEEKKKERHAKREEAKKAKTNERIDELNQQKASKIATPKPSNTERKASPTSVSDLDSASFSATEKQSSKAVKPKAFVAVPRSKQSGSKVVKPKAAAASVAVPGSKSPAEFTSESPAPSSAKSPVVKPKAAAAYVAVPGSKSPAEFTSESPAPSSAKSPVVKPKAAVASSPAKHSVAISSSKSPVESWAKKQASSTSAEQPKAKRNVASSKSKKQKPFLAAFFDPCKQPGATSAASASRKPPPAKKQKIFDAMHLYGADESEPPTEKEFGSAAKYFAARAGRTGWGELPPFDQSLVTNHWRAHNRRAKEIKRERSGKPAKDFFGRAM